MRRVATVGGRPQRIDEGHSSSHATIKQFDTTTQPMPAASQSLSIQRFAKHQCSAEQHSVHQYGAVAKKHVSVTSRCYVTNCPGVVVHATKVRERPEGTLCEVCRKTSQWSETDVWVAFNWSTLVAIPADGAQPDLVR
eukprot:9497965-Pyramimonas_sp.AAC.2